MWVHAIAISSPFESNEYFPFDVFVPICYTPSDVLTNCLFNFLSSGYPNSKNRLA